MGLWPDATGWSDAYSFTAGACNIALHKMQPDGQRAMLMTCFNTCVVRDCVPSQAAHRAFLTIDDYRLAISPDQLGAEDGNGPLNNPWKKVVADGLDHASPPHRPPPPR